MNFFTIPVKRERTRARARARERASERASERESERARERERPANHLRYVENTFYREHILSIPVLNTELGIKRKAPTQRESVVYWYSI